MCNKSSYSRTDDAQIGFSLNLTGCNAQNIENISKAVRTLYPQLVRIDLSLDQLNKKRFVPVTNHDLEFMEMDQSNRGLLQVADETLVLVNELALMEGKLEERGFSAIVIVILGIHNLMALQRLMNTNKLSLDGSFGYELNIKASFLTLSEGKSLLPVSIAFHRFLT